MGASPQEKMQKVLEDLEVKLRKVKGFRIISE
jgi:predicted regulator of Ras-like GTPase activity (Roadblock/LC7/MglB family)